MNVDILAIYESRIYYVRKYKNARKRALTHISPLRKRNINRFFLFAIPCEEVQSILEVLD